MTIIRLGEPRFPSPQKRTISENARLPENIVRDADVESPDDLLFELAGPRKRLYFEPSRARAAIVNCGGLCPGLNNVIRSIVLELYHGYGVSEVWGIRDGYMGLDPTTGRDPLRLTMDLVDDIHKDGGTILGTSRGPVDIAASVDYLIRERIDMLFTVGGDGTQRGGKAIFEEAQRRGHPLAVVGIPKTIDNDVPYVTRTFGYFTAVEEAAKMLHAAHTEAHSVQNGISVVKLMGRNAGFIACGATIASQDVNFCLVPEVPFTLEGEAGLLEALKRRIRRRSHALLVVAEGAAQDLMGGAGNERDASGNVKLKDVGPWLKGKIEDYFRTQGIPTTIRYIDPSYLIRSVPADAEDAILCDQFARHAVHAAMAGKTGLVIGMMHDRFIHVPVELLTQAPKRVDPQSDLWQAVLATTGQKSQ